MLRTPRHQPRVKREDSDEDPEPTLPDWSHVPRRNNRVKREDTEEDPEPTSNTSTSTTSQGPRRSLRAQLNKKVGLRIHTPEQSKHVKEIHYVSETKPPTYGSDINMTRDAYQCIRKVDADDNSVATDNPKGPSRV